MRDLCMNQIEDIVWSDHDQVDDHVVPHPHEMQDVRPMFHGDGLKTHQSQGAGVTSNATDCRTTMYVNKGSGERRDQSFINSRDIILEENLWSRSAEGIFRTSHDNESNEETKNLTSDDTKMSTQCFENRNTESIGTDFSTDNLVISEGCGAVDTDSYYPLGDIIQADNDLSFCEDKDSNDLLYYGWSSIGNFEDVDRMFSSSDSTFGLGNVGHEDQLNWFSSSHTIGGSEDVLNSGSQFSCPDSSPLDTVANEDCGSGMNNASSFVNDTNVDSVSLCYRSSLEALNGSGSDANYGRNDTFPPVQQGAELNGNVCGIISTDNHAKNESYGMISFQKKHAKHRNKSEGKRKDRDLENGRSHIHRSNMQSDDKKTPSKHSSLTSLDIGQQKKSMNPTNTLAFPHTRVPYTNLDHIHCPGQIPFLSTPSGVNSDSSGLATLSHNDPSNASNLLRSMGGLQNWPVDVSSIPVNVSLQSQQEYYPSYTSNPVQVGLVDQSAMCGPISDPMQVQYSQREFENHNQIDRIRVKTPEDVDTSHVQESSCISSGLDEIPQEASSFRQLQQVMEHLDIRTKLCIRDSLYRLARSAEQRHPYAILGSNGGSDQDPNADAGEGRRGCSGFLNIETDTNPIDRSIAHLLFHRPSDSSGAQVPPDGGLPLDSNSMAQGGSPPPVGNEQAAAEMEQDE